MWVSLENDGLGTEQATNISVKCMNESQSFTFSSAKNRERGEG